jgi:hypothetical protein
VEPLDPEKYEVTILPDGGRISRLRPGYYRKPDETAVGLALAGLRGDPVADQALADYCTEHRQRNDQAKEIARKSDYDEMGAAIRGDRMFKVEVEGIEHPIYYKVWEGGPNFGYLYRCDRWRNCGTVAEKDGVWFFQKPAGAQWQSKVLVQADLHHAKYWRRLGDADARDRWLKKELTARIAAGVAKQKAEDAAEDAARAAGCCPRCAAFVPDRYLCSGCGMTME